MKCRIVFCCMTNELFSPVQFVDCHISASLRSFRWCIHLEIFIESSTDLTLKTLVHLYFISQSNIMTCLLRHRVDCWHWLELDTAYIFRLCITFRWWWIITTHVQTETARYAYEFICTNRQSAIERFKVMHCYQSIVLKSFICRYHDIPEGQDSLWAERMFDASRHEITRAIKTITTFLSVKVSTVNTLIPNCRNLTLDQLISNLCTCQFAWRPFTSTRATCKHLSSFKHL